MLTTGLGNRGTQFAQEQLCRVIQQLPLNLQGHQGHLQQLTMLGAAQLLFHLPHLWT